MKKLFSKKSTKIICAVVAVLMATGVTGVVYASSKPAEQSPVTKPSQQETLSDVVKIDTGSSTAGKEETIYVIANANGASQQVIVSDWLKNPEKAASLADYSELSDIVNTNGDEAYTASDNHALTWAANGNDIHYQGTTGKALPVSVKLTYYLNGTEIKPEDLAGKQGHVKIRFDYTNSQKYEATIDGAPENISVPFLMVSGTALDNKVFSNVSVSSGQIVNDGSRSVIIGYALPGMSDSLDLTDDDFDIPEFVEIEADTTGFSLPATLTVGMTGLFNNVQIDSQGSLDDLKKSMSDLEDATLALIDGSSDLYDGIAKLYASSKDLKSGAGQLVSGAQQLQAGAEKANAGAAKLKNGLATLSGNSDSLRGGAKQVIDAVFESATTQLRAQLVSSGLMTSSQAAAITLTSSNYISVFQSLSSAATVTPAQVEAQLRAKLTSMPAAYQDVALTIAYDLMAADSSLNYTTAVTNAAQMVKDAGDVATAISVINDPWKTAYAALISPLIASGYDADTAAKIAAVALSLNASDPASQFSAAGTMLQHAGTVAATVPSTDKITALCTAVANAATSTGNASLDGAKKKLDDVMSFYNGLQIYTKGVDSASGGSSDLAAGTASLSSGSGDLYKGLSTLYSGTGQLVSGVSQLYSGSQQLKDGVQQFYDDGIKKLTDMVNGDLTKLLNRLSAVADASKSYQSFAGKADGMDGSVKFIFRTDSVE